MFSWMTDARSTHAEPPSTAFAVAALAAAAVAAWANSLAGEWAESLPETVWFALDNGHMAISRGISLALHVATAAVMFVVLRRTLQLPHLRERFGRNGSWLALAVSAIWMLHPLQTAAVTDVTRRPELVAGLAVMVTLQAVMQGRRVVAVAACALGMLAHELAAAIPVLALLYDRTFLTGSFRETLRARGGIYAMLAATWLLLAGRVMLGDFSSEAVPYGAPATPWVYLQVQCQAVVHYLRLALWPEPLVFDYGVMRPGAFVWVLPPAFFLLSLAVVSIVALWQVRARGFLGAWFFLLLLATSSAWPIPHEPMAESRMHLPLAAVVTLVVLGVYRMAGTRAVAICALVALALGAATVRRNLDYRDPLPLWMDTAEKMPGNARAHVQVATWQLSAGHVAEAIASGAEAVGLDPYNADAHFALGQALQQAGRAGPARRHLEQAVKLEPERFGTK